tara:strand:- start:41 stop:445 length:405 start_codon:yes stop_codon:yes gene_type:complete
MAEEILYNDGGAPARILPFIAGEALSAGDVLAIGNDGNLIKADTTHSHGAGHREYCIGVSLLDTALGDMASVVSGKGIVVNANTVGSLSAGKGLKVGAVAGQYAAATAFTENVCAVLMEDSTDAGLYKVMIIGG